MFRITPSRIDRGRLSVQASKKSQCEATNNEKANASLPKLSRRNPRRSIPSLGAQSGSATVKVANVIEHQPIEGHLIIDLNAAKKICFNIEVLGRPDVRYLIEEYFDSLK